MEVGGVCMYSLGVGGLGVGGLGVGSLGVGSLGVYKTKVKSWKLEFMIFYNLW